MQLPALVSLASLALAAAHSLTISIPSVPALQNPWTLPVTTHATLSSLSERYSAPLSDRNTMTFHNITGPGSYLLDIHCMSYAFIPFRVDIAADGSLYAWETYRGNDWENRGEAVPAKEFGVRGGKAERGFEARVAGVKGYYVERSKFNIVNIVMKNPMILMGLVTMGIFVGMPYLMKNMDPEMRAEFEARQAQGPLGGLLGGATGQGGAAAPSFDMAGFLAGSQGQQQGQQRQPSGSGGNNNKKGRKA